MIIKLIRFLNKRIRKQHSIQLFRKTIKAKGGSCGKCLYLAHPECIQFEKLFIKDGFRIECYTEYAGVEIPQTKISFSNNVIIGYNFTALVANNITVGSNTIFASNVALISENHGIEVETEVPYYAQKLSTGPITIGEGCWLGQNVIILPNVTIGDKCIIGSNSVVTKSIPSFSIAVGMPARVVKTYNFELHCWVKV